PDQEVHRDEHRVPEDVEEEQVERDEDAEHRRLEGEQEEREQLDVLVDRLPRGEQRQRRQHPRQHDQEEADAVDAEVVGDAELRQPLAVLDELVVGADRVERPPQVEGGGEREQRDAERDVAHQRLALRVVAAAAGEQHQQRAGERQKNDRGEQHLSRQIPAEDYHNPQEERR